MRKNNRQNSLSADVLSSIFCIAGEMVKSNGEDSYYYAMSDTAAVISSFDGCGGIGSRRYGNYSGKTGAYIASRAVCGGVKAWFESNSDNEEAIYEYIKRALGVCDKYADNTGRLMGSLGKSFPTTAAIVYVQRGRATCFWAGDSRCYMLDSDGLHQLSEDDINGEDALSNISGDGVLTNVICSSSEFVLHKKVIPLNKPCILLTATDGCFGYLNTPMDFEYLLTSTLMSAKSIIDWKIALNSSIREYTGDDYTLCAALYGFSDFKSVQKVFENRNMYVNNQYIKSDIGTSEKWNLYKKEYSLYMQGGR